jgi:hypothetical protein
MKIKVKNSKITVGDKVVFDNTNAEEVNLNFTGDKVVTEQVKDGVKHTEVEYLKPENKDTKTRKP